MRQHIKTRSNSGTPSPGEIQALALQHIIAWRGNPYRDHELARAAYGAAALMLSMLPAVESVGGMQ